MSVYHGHRMGEMTWNNIYEQEPPDGENKMEKNTSYVIYDYSYFGLV